MQAFSEGWRQSIVFASRLVEETLQLTVQAQSPPQHPDLIRREREDDRNRHGDEDGLAGHVPRVYMVPLPYETRDRCRTLRRTGIADHSFRRRRGEPQV